MAIKLYAGSGSPFTWRVWLALEHKGIPYDLQMLSFQAGDHKKPEYLALNPRGKVPTIVDGDFTLYESAAITRYLDETYPEKPLFPRGVRERALVNRLLAEIDSYVAEAQERLVGSVLFTPKDKWNPEAIEAARQDFVAELARFQGYLAGKEWLAGPLTAADFALYPLLALALRIETRFKPDLGFASVLGPDLKAWKARVEALPYYDKTYPPHWRDTK